MKRRKRIKKRIPKSETNGIADVLKECKEIVRNPIMIKIDCSDSERIANEVKGLEKTDNIALNQNVLERQVNFDLNLKETVEVRNESFQKSLQEKELDSMKENNQSKEEFVKETQECNNVIDVDHNLVKEGEDSLTGTPTVADDPSVKMNEKEDIENKLDKEIQESVINNEIQITADADNIQECEEMTLNLSGCIIRALLQLTKI